MASVRKVLKPRKEKKKEQWESESDVANAVAFIFRIRVNQMVYANGCAMNREISRNLPSQTLETLTVDDIYSSGDLKALDNRLPD